MTTAGSSEDHNYTQALDTAEQLLGFRLETFLEAATGEPANAADFKRIATVHAFGDSWPRTDLLDTRSRALVSVATTASLGIHQRDGARSADNGVGGVWSAPLMTAAAHRGERGEQNSAC